MSDSWKSEGLTLVRWTVAVIAVMHGLANALGLFGGPGLERFAAELEPRLGIGAPVIGTVVAIGQLVGGIAMLLGPYARLVAMLFIAFLVANVLVLDKLSAFFVRNQGFEFDLALITLCVVVATQGPGAMVMHLPKRKKQQSR